MFRFAYTVIGCVLLNLACTDSESPDGKLLAGATVEVESVSLSEPIQILGAGDDMGACCRNGASRAPVMCMEISRDNCAQSRGIFAAGQECGPDTCRSGPCCVDRICDRFSGQCCENPPGENCDLTQPFIGCAHVIQLYCASIEGEFGGVGSSCSTVECEVATGACCVNDGVSPPGCVDADALSCLEMGGEYGGDGTNCVDDPCIFDEACCFSSGVCHDLNADLCVTEGGAPGGLGSHCTRFQAGSLAGACCIPNPQRPSGFECAELSANLCSHFSGEFRGVGTLCECATCDDDFIQACCTAVGNCFDLTPEVCSREGGASAGPGTSCQNTECSQQEGD